MKIRTFNVSFFSSDTSTTQCAPSTTSITNTSAEPVPRYKLYLTRCKGHRVRSPSHSMPVLSKEKPLEHSQLKLPGVLTQEAREPHPLFWAAHSLLSAKRRKTDYWDFIWIKDAFFCYSSLRKTKLFFFWCMVTLIFSCLVLTNTGSLVLCETRRTLAGEASNGVETEELAIMLLGWTFIQILEGKKEELNVHLNQIT